MIRFSFSIAWPFTYKDKLRHFLLYDKRIASNKYLELQVSQFGCDCLIDFDLNLTWRGYDHAGPGFEVTVLGFFFSAKIYDSRHWDYDSSKWEHYDDNRS